MSSNGQPGFQVASHRLGYDSVISCTAQQLKPQSGNVLSFLSTQISEKQNFDAIC